jgi:hypothetical protein
MSDNHTIHEHVMKQIQQERIVMYPRAYFIIGSLLVGAGMAGAVVTSVFFTHITLYRLRYDAVFNYLDFGSPGLQPFMHAFPWGPFIIAVCGLLGGSYLLQEHEMPYKYRYKRVSLIFIALLITLGVMLDRSGIREQIANIRPLQGWYEYNEKRPYVFGKVVEIQDGVAIIVTPQNDRILMSVRSPSQWNMIGKGDMVHAIGGWSDNMFHVYHLRVK